MGMGRLLGSGGVWGAIFTNFTLAVGLEHDIFFSTDRNLTDCLHTGSRAISALRREDVRMRTAIILGLLVPALFLPIRSRLTRQHTVGHPHWQGLGSRFLVHRLTDNSH